MSKTPKFAPDRRSTLMDRAQSCARLRHIRARGWLLWMAVQLLGQERGCQGETAEAGLGRVRHPARLRAGIACRGARPLILGVRYGWMLRGRAVRGRARSATATFPWAGFALVVMLIAIIGGRIIPAFTRNWLVKHGHAHRLPIMANRFDHALLAVTAVTLAGWVLAPEARAVAVRLLCAGLLHAVRLTRWAGLSAIRDPLVFVLHVAYARLPAGLLLLGGAKVMTRATRGHTSRPLEADGATIAIYVLVNLGVLLRVAAPLLPLDYMLSIRLAGGLWGGAFLLFVCIHGHMVLQRPNS